MIPPLFSCHKMFHVIRPSISSTLKGPIFHEYVIAGVLSLWIFFLELTFKGENHV
jgi:hypothetical protein